MRFEYEPEPEPDYPGEVVRKKAVILTPIEGEDLVSVRTLPLNYDFLLPPMVTGELAVALMNSALCGASEAEAEAVRENALAVLTGNRPDAMYVDHGREAMRDRVANTFARRQMHDVFDDRTMFYDTRSIGFPTVENGVSNNAHLSRVEVSTLIDQRAPDATCKTTMRAINRGGVVATSTTLPPAMAYNVANGLLSMWREHAPVASVTAMRERIVAMCRTKADPSPVAKVKGFYGAAATTRRRPAAEAADAPAVDGDALLDELTSAARPRR